MAMLFPVILFAILALTSAGQSPNAHLVEELIKSGQGTRYSTNVILDALLDVPALVARYNYPIEVHRPVTSDGYVLGMHRIRHGRDNNQFGENKPVVFIMHGLFSSSADFVLLGPGNAIAYLLAEEGFDVWLGNARGNYYSRAHLTLDPDTDKDFWRFSWDEIGNLDLAAMIDYIRITTGQEKVHYIGHSQGGTSFLVLNSLRPEFSDKIASFHGLAPASFFIHNDQSLINALAPYQRLIEGAVFTVGTGEFLPNIVASTAVTIAVCSDHSFLQPLCHSLPLIGGAISLYNSTMIPLFIGHTPAGASIRQLAHYAQSINRGEFRRFDHGILGNIAAYGRVTPPAYNLGNIATPSYIYYGMADTLVHYEDIYHLSQQLPNVELHRVPREDFNHVDFMWGRDVRDMFYLDLITTLKQCVQKYGPSA